mmetsp:Transcript_34246/g.70114  ORF Transcript_34246/g.70114 Transcript_34246/m.70114 type:complete len:736 (-) Transcript_34246:4037-6244(-)
MSEGQGTKKAAGGHGRGGRGGGRGGRGSGSKGRGRHHQQSKNHSQQKQQHGGGKGRGRDQKQRPRSLSNQDKSHEYYLAKKSIVGPYAHLYSSQFHGFALSRTILRHQIEEQKKNSYESGLQKLLHPYYQKEADDQKHRVDETWWEAVKLVRCHAPMNESDANSFERCPICLDEDMTAPYIAPCGHSFCLPCVLGYLNAVAKDLNAESERLHKSKQSKGRVVGNTGCSVPSASVTCVRARCPMCSSGSSMELNAGDAMITYKDLRPLVFVPVMKVKTATKMKFVKLHRSKGCSAPYLPLEGHRVRGSHSMQQEFPELPDGDDDSEEVTYARQYFVGLEEFSSLLQRQIRELNDYRNEPVCKMDPREEWNVSMASEAVKASQRRWLDNGVVEGFISVEMSSKLEQQQHLQNSRFVQSTTIADNQNESQVGTDVKSKSKKSSLLCHGTTYLNRCEPSASTRNETDEYAYYQSCDGQLCFISGVDVACLLNEFSLHNVLEDGATHYDRSKMPLPDEVLATVLATEDEVLTHSLMKRKPFLSHYPLGCTVTFVELDWHSGGEGGNKPLLSQRTLKRFRDELNHRKAERIRLAKKEEKADKIARAKAEKINRQRRIDLYGTDSTDGFERQTIDPDDEFFRALALSAGETEEDATTTSTFSFNQVCAENGVFPSLAPSGTLASSPPKEQTQSSWGSRTNHQSPKSPKDNFPSLSESISLNKKSVKSTSSAAKVGTSRWGIN